MTAPKKQLGALWATTSYGKDIDATNKVQDILRGTSLQQLAARAAACFHEVVVLGPRSAGKTTLLRLLSGCDFPTEANGCTLMVTRIVLQQNLRASPKLVLKLLGKRDKKAYVELVAEGDPDEVDLATALTEAQKRAFVLANQEANVGFIEDYEIVVTVTKPDICNLTFVDVPGFVPERVDESVGEDPRVVERLAARACASKNAFVLYVVPANQDPVEWLGQSFVSKLPNEVIHVVSKWDQLESGCVESSIYRCARHATIRGTRAMMLGCAIKEEQELTLLYDLFEKNSISEDLKKGFIMGHVELMELLAKYLSKQHHCLVATLHKTMLEQHTLLTRRMQDISSWSPTAELRSAENAVAAQYAVLKKSRSDFFDRIYRKIVVAVRNCHAIPLRRKCEGLPLRPTSKDQVFVGSKVFIAETVIPSKVAAFKSYREEIYKKKAPVPVAAPEANVFWEATVTSISDEMYDCFLIQESERVSVNLGSIRVWDYTDVMLEDIREMIQIDGDGRSLESSLNHGVVEEYVVDWANRLKTELDVLGEECFAETTKTFRACFEKSAIPQTVASTAGTSLKERLLKERLQTIQSDFNVSMGNLWEFNKPPFVFTADDLLSRTGVVEFPRGIQCGNLRQKYNSTAQQSREEMVAARVSAYVARQTEFVLDHSIKILKKHYCEKANREFERTLQDFLSKDIIASVEIEPNERKLERGCTQKELEALDQAFQALRIIHCS